MVIFVCKKSCRAFVISNILPWRVPFDLDFCLLNYRASRICGNLSTGHKAHWGKQELLAHEEGMLLKQIWPQSLPCLDMSNLQQQDTAASMVQRRVVDASYSHHLHLGQSIRFQDGRTWKEVPQWIFIFFVF